MMLIGPPGGALELRRDGAGRARVTGRFPYDIPTELAPGRSETIEARAFAARLEAGAEVHFLAGHDFDKPLAARSAGTLRLTDTAEALELEAEIDPGTSWARDFLAAHAAGLVRGLSPGFRVTPGGESVERSGAGLLRRIRAAELIELSAVTVPAYPAAQIDARSWTPTRGLEAVRALIDAAEYVTPFYRWRP